jgi:hypothetical protein
MLEGLVGGVAVAPDGLLHARVDARLVITELCTEFREDVALRSLSRRAEVEWWARLGSNQ